VSDTIFIKKALSLAARARGMTSPNPMVGAVLVKDGKIIAEGYHRKAGFPHAEVIAIEKAGSKAPGATLYVNLEPCCHRDKKTPPCTEKIISSGIKRVVVSMIDPNPKVSGRGIEILRNAGIEVKTGILESKARELNEPYIKHITTGMPFVILKIAMTLDGKIATPEGESEWITGEKSRRLVHKLRGTLDAVMTAIGTVKADDPELTCRLKRYRNPARVIIDPDMEVRTDAKVTTTPPHTILVVKTSTARTAKIEDKMKKYVLEERGIKFIEYEGDKVDLSWLMSELANANIMSVLIEGGASLNCSCLQSGVVDKVMFFIAPKIIGGRESIPAVGGNYFRRLEDAYHLTDIEIKKIGEDILVEGYIEK
jgi:diaminohydroxyphosphoribosylaminopyrimidine deaminase/5-amino-6-(5-phosphoribosylamino)uracil reductase